MFAEAHALSGWCLANAGRGLTARERFFCMLAAVLPDADAVSYLAGRACYQEWHHKAGHNLWVGLVACAAMSLTSSRRASRFLLYLAFFHLHLGLDYLGSGFDWPIYYLWPASEWFMENPRVWELYSWQNMLANYLLVGWTLAIAIRCGRTPLEYPMPGMDRKLSGWALSGWRWLRSLLPSTR